MRLTTKKYLQQADIFRNHRLQFYSTKLSLENGKIQEDFFQSAKLDEKLF